MRAQPRAMPAPDVPAIPVEPPPPPTELAAIYAEYADLVYARLTRLIGPTDDRADVLQQVFLQLHRALPGYRGEASIATFLYRITVHVAYDHLRQRRRRPAPVEPQVLDAMLADEPSPEQRTQRREELAQLFEHLAWLSPEKRVAIVLVSVEGLSLREAAELVGATPDAVKQRVLHGRRELLARIAKQESR